MYGCKKKLACFSSMSSVEHLDEQIFEEVFFFFFKGINEGGILT
jgi:hypothetical protein